MRAAATTTVTAAALSAKGAATTMLFDLIFSQLLIEDLGQGGTTKVVMKMQV